MNRPLFTVIVPVYQVEAYLAQCLDSFLPQCNEGVQILLVDDGSTDGSLQILRAYEQRYQNVTVISQPNSGVAHARNTGLRHAQGDYILWVDPDDWVSPAWLQTIQDAIQSSGPDMLFFDYTASNNGAETRRCYGGAAGSIPASQFLYDLTEDTRLTSVLWNKVIRRELLDGLCFDETLHCMEDAELLYRLASRIQSVEYLPVPLYFYRIRPGGLVLTPDLSVAYRCFQLATERREAIAALGYDTCELGEYLQAKGFLCKYYRAGFPKAYRKEYRQIRTWLVSRRGSLLASQRLTLKDKLKYLLIANPLVGAGYAALKRLRSTNGGVS